MKFDSQSSRRRKQQSGLQLATPVVVEHLETRSLLTAPALLTPTANAVVSDATPVISWEATDTAVSYDLWINDADARQVLQVIEDIPTTNIELTTALPLARIRVWVRANLADTTSTEWSAVPLHFIVQQRPAITGPVNAQLPGTPRKLNTGDVDVTWTSAAGAASFEIWFRNEQTKVITTQTVSNPGPSLDANGDPILDGNGDPVLTEIRSFNLGKSLEMGGYQVAVRATDSAGRMTPWTDTYKFEVAPAVQITGPVGATFDNPPLLEWSAVDGATHYDLWVALVGSEGAGQELYRYRQLTTTSYQIPRALADGNYVFWVRARNQTIATAEVVGIWSDRTEFSPITATTETTTNRVVKINGPVGEDSNDPDQILVTDLRPTVTWNAVDGAARYDVWIDQATGPSGYIVTTSSINSYTFSSDITVGNHYVWIRAISQTGKATRWSLPYEFFATAGAPVVLSPVADSVADSLPTIRWTPVSAAATYEIWISEVGVNYTYLVQNGLTTNEFTPPNPLNAGTFRVWVRAIQSDGTTLNWSDPVTFFVVDATETSAGNVMLTALLNEVVTAEVVNDAHTAHAVSERSLSAEEPSSESNAELVRNRNRMSLTARQDAADVPRQLDLSGTSGSPAGATMAHGDNFSGSDFPIDVIEQLATEFVAEQWWESSEESV